ncbi:MAG: O-antigen ligase family protein, partial [Longimicrobiales bacterium]
MSSDARQVPTPDDSAACVPPVEVAIAGPTRAERRALRVLQAGAVLVVLAAATWKAFELDRFFVPKELVLHLSACIAALLVVRSVRAARFSWVDLLLLLHLALGLVSAVVATNHWLAMRALAISVSAVAIFWAARVLRTAGLARPLLGALALAVVIGCITSLMQTYGVETEFFSLNRAPGGTFGNRNFVAHMAAFGLPVVLLLAIDARRWPLYLLGVVGATLVVATLFLTRSRAAWLAFGAVGFVFITALVLSSALRRDARTWRRLLGIAVVGAAGIAAALLVPNALDWTSDNPYLESMRDVANYEEGSGRGRLVQYRQSLAMAAAHPLLGVGPGNWAVAYPEHAASNDPSMSNSSAGMTSNPWPSSDWVAVIAERGFPAALLLVLAVMGIAVSGLQRLISAASAHDALRATTLLATLLGACVSGMFDAVLLLALPTLLVWAAVGVLYEPAASRLAPPAALRPAALIA